MKLSSRSSFATAVALGTFAIVGGTGLTVSSAWLITMAAQHPPVLVLGVAIVMVRFFGIFRSVARYGERVISHEAIFAKLTSLRVKLFSAFASQLREDGSSISSRSKAAIDDVERAQEYHLRITLPGLYALFSGIATLLIAAWIGDVLFLIATAITLLFALAIPMIVRSAIDPLAIEIEDRENLLAEEIGRASHAQREAEVFGYLKVYQDRLKSSVESLKSLESKFYLRTSLLQNVVILSIGSGLIAVSLSARNNPSLLPIQVSMSLFLILIGFEGYTTWFPNLFLAGKNRRASKTVEELSHSASVENQNYGKPRGCVIQAEKVQAYWDQPFLAPLSFEVAEGETLLITGASGVGKSTMASAVLGFARYEGSLTVGGVEVRDVAELERHVSAALQDSHIFNTTLRENLKIANEEIDDQKLLEILAAFELDAISLDELLGEYGRPLSGGEAKRLAVARALLSPAPVIILDEPLEHLDHERARRIEKAISEFAAGRTLIVITHAPWLQYSRKLRLERE
jgi:ATP-binding cassette, subfamily C, bacterial CydC